MQTLLIDIEDTLVSKVEINCLTDLVQLKMDDNFETNYIVIQQNDSTCICNTDACVCTTEVYKIRPYALQLMRAIRPYIEVIAFTNWPEQKLNHVILHLEEVLN